MRNWIWMFVILTTNVFGYKSNTLTKANWKRKSSLTQDKIKGNNLYSKDTKNIVRVLNPLSPLNTLSVRGGALAHLSTPISMEKFLYAVDLFGTGVFAFSGALIAGKKGMDLIGMLYIAVISATGGGTLRDLLLDSGAVFWIRHPIYFHICLGMTLATYLFWPTLETKMGWKDSNKSICTADAFGLGAFAVLGTQKAADLGLHPIMWIVVGTITSTFGGITRDVLCLQQPRVMYPTRTLYAIHPFLGATMYTVLTYKFQMYKEYAAFIAFLTTFLTRVLSFESSRRLPHWNIKK